MCKMCWGTYRCGSESLLLRRFIPACAGNAADRRVSKASLSVHPRVCGERAAAVAASCSRGSSPRVRGTERMLNGRRHRGSSPRVRGTRMCDSRAWLPPVHPRVCGEHALMERLVLNIPNLKSQFVISEFIPFVGDERIVEDHTLTNTLT